MVKYARASDSIVSIVGEGGTEKTVTEREFNLVYAAQGYRRSSEVTERELLKKNNTAKELEVMLDEKGVDYPSSATKDELVDLIIGE